MAKWLPFPITSWKLKQPDWPWGSSSIVMSIWYIEVFEGMTADCPTFFELRHFPKYHVHSSKKPERRWCLMWHDVIGWNVTKQYILRHHTWSLVRSTRRCGIWDYYFKSPMVQWSVWWISTSGPFGWDQAQMSEQLPGLVVCTSSEKNVQMKSWPHFHEPKLQIVEVTNEQIYKGNQRWSLSRIWSHAINIFSNWLQCLSFLSLQFFWGQSTTTAWPASPCARMAKVGKKTETFVPDKFRKQKAFTLQAFVFSPLPWGDSNSFLSAFFLLFPMAW